MIAGLVAVVEKIRLIKESITRKSTWSINFGTMASLIRNISRALETIAPLRLAEKWDNVSQFITFGNDPDLMDSRSGLSSVTLSHRWHDLSRLMYALFRGSYSQGKIEQNLADHRVSTALPLYHVRNLQSPIV